MKSIRMPRSLDDQLYVLFWSADELLPGLAIFILGVLINQKLACLVLALAITRLFRRVKEGTPDGFLLHLAYWHGFIAIRSYSLPNALIREFIV